MKKTNEYNELKEVVGNLVEELSCLNSHLDGYHNTTANRVNPALESLGLELLEKYGDEGLEDTEVVEVSEDDYQTLREVARVLVEEVNEVNEDLGGYHNRTGGLFNDDLARLGLDVVKEVEEED